MMDVSVTSPAISPCPFVIRISTGSGAPPHAATASAVAASRCLCIAAIVTS